ncbi:MAG TPA: cytochrome c oxidase subunit II [Solirubrobacterales bacterium]|nr:cytochrome c oxidase subunit II [Solirubrobacterales bacterium]
MKPKAASGLGLAVLLAALAMAVFAAPAQATIFGPRAGHSPNADDIRTAYWIAITVAALLVIAIHVLGIAAIVRFRARRGRTPRRFSAAQGALTRPAVPLVIVAAGMFIVGVVMAGAARDVKPTGPEGLAGSRSLVAQVGGLAATADTKPLTINVIGQQWLWRFEYPGGRQGDRVFSYGELVVPVDTAVVLRITSTDVMHRWFIPTLGGQVDAVPGKTAETWFRADREGVYRGQSTSFAYSAFSVMRAWVRVVSPAAYEDYVQRKRTELRAAQGYVLRRVAKSAIQGGGP